jgi:hypothetical protein
MSGRRREGRLERALTDTVSLRTRVGCINALIPSSEVVFIDAADIPRDEGTHRIKAH